jgi:hypothetical protein
MSSFKPLCAAALAATTGLAHADFVGSLGPIAAPANVAFLNNNVTASGTLPATFLDQWTFSLVSPATVSSLAAAFSFGGPAAFGITNLQVNLLDATLGTVASGWQTVSVNGPFTQTVSITPAAGLTADNYTLQVRGTLIGAPAAYSGSLIAAAPTSVPLPAAMPLLLVGLAVLRGVGRRRPAAAATVA